MRYLMLALMTFGFLTFTNAQDYNNDDCPPASSKTEAEEDMYQESDEANADVESEAMDTENEDLDASTTASTTEITVVEEENKDGFLENVVEAPFKVVAHTVGEVGEGVGHIIGAPFKGIGRLFGWGDNDEDDKRYYEKQQTTTITSTETETKKEDSDSNLDVDIDEGNVDVEGDVDIDEGNIELEEEGPDMEEGEVEESPEMEEGNDDMY